MDKPLILIVNDDSIFSNGIRALWEAMSEIGKVVVVAPKTEKSASGHSITISNPIRIQKIVQSNDFEGFAIHGTPADSVKIGVKVILETSPDIIVSGINSGPNVGQSLRYSGTVSAAAEGTFLGIPSIALSLNCFKPNNFNSAKIIAKEIVNKALAKGLPDGTLLNVNIPDLPSKNIKGYKITEQGSMYFLDEFEKRKDPHGFDYYWLKADSVDPDSSINFDKKALESGWGSITPLQLKMTNKDFIQNLHSWDFN